MGQISLSDIVSQLSVALDAVESDLLGASAYHSKRVSVFSLAVGRELGYSEARLFGLATCAMLHDNALTEYILSEKPNKDQALNMKSHCIIGEENCKFLPMPYDVSGFILYHHENSDGSGAFGKKIGEYPQEADIIALTDKIDVKFRLQNSTVSNLHDITDYINKIKGTKYSAAVAAAAQKVLSKELQDSMSNECIFDTVRNSLPNIKCQLKDTQILRIAGIIAKIIDYKSEFTREHSTQIANKAWYISGIYNYPLTLRANLYLAAAMHDIGKLFIPLNILEKNSKLTPEEFEIIKSHAKHTWDVLSSISGFDEIALWASEHHEKLDGSGYPFGKTGDVLSFNSRLLACLDIYQAVRETRPYHPSRSHQETMVILYDLAKKGLVDLNISKDLDKYLRRLENGRAPIPKMEENSSI